MNRRLAIGFPYLCAAVVIALVFWDVGRRDVLPARSVLAYSSLDEAGSAVRKDPVCNMDVGPGIAFTVEEDTFSFCTERCRQLFAADPHRYLGAQCLVCKAEGAHAALSFPGGYEATWQGNTYSFCSEEHRGLFASDPAGYFMHTMWGIPNWLYYASIAAILLVTFCIFEWRAARTGGTVNGTLAERHAWRAERPRFDVFSFTVLRRVAIHPATRFLLRSLILALFVLVVAAGLFGNQLPSKNIAPLLTWTIWWGGLVVLVLYAGTAWCYVCPWDTIADWAEGLRMWGRKKDGMSLGLKLPNVLKTIWPATFFFVALTWLELGFGVTMNPRATAWLALGMVGFAFVCAFIFDRKAFCRYGCLVGRITGLYSLFSPVEVRVKDASVCRTCATQSCFKGNSRGEACPTFQYLPAMEQNTNCLSCMECLKSCELGNVGLHLRPWGEDLAMVQRPRADEAYLALVLITLTGFHGLTMTGAWGEVLAFIEGFGVGSTLAFSFGMAALMVAPTLGYAFLVALSRLFAGGHTKPYSEYFVRYAYALLPIALFYHLAHNSEHLLMEGQKIVSLLSDPFGFEWNLFGTAHWTLAPIASLPTLWIVQVLLVLVGHVYSLWVARRVSGALFAGAGQAFRSQTPMLAAMVLFSVLSLWLLKQPMVMRISAM